MLAALEKIIFEPKMISIEKADKNHGIELATRFTNKDAIYHDGYDAKYFPSNYIHGDTLNKLIYSLNIDLSKFLKKAFCVESAQDKIFYIENICVDFICIQP